MAQQPLLDPGQAVQVADEILGDRSVPADEVMEDWLAARSQDSADLAMHRAQHNGTDDGIQAWRVTAARGDCNSHCLPAVPSRISRTTSPDSAWRFVLFLE